MKPSAQRLALLEMAQALGCRDNALRRDECGDWRIKSRFGWIYAVPEGFHIYFRGADEFEEPISSKGWTFAKQAMSFAGVFQDGDSEGTLIFNRLPLHDEAEIIREKLRIAKKREISEEERVRLAQTAFRPRPKVE